MKVFRWIGVALAVLMCIGIGARVIMSVVREVQHRQAVAASSGDTSSGAAPDSAANADTAAAGGDNDWNVGPKTDKLTDTTSYEAIMTHKMQDGGRIIVLADCESDAIRFSFEYHDAKDDDKSAYESNSNSVAVPYRLDGGEVTTATENTKYENSASVTFMHLTDDDKKEASNSGVSGMTFLLASVAAGDLKALLHSHRVRFQLPVSGKEAEVIEFDPQSSALQEFVKDCKIDVAAMDRQVQTQEAQPSNPSSPNSSN